MLALFNSNTLNLMMLWWLMKGCMDQLFCNAVWIAELARVKKVEVVILGQFNYSGPNWSTAVA